MSAGLSFPETPPPASAPSPLNINPLPPAVQDTRGATLLLYLLGGIGLFIAGSVVVGQSVGADTTILASAAAFALNVACFVGAAYLLGVYRQGLSWAEFGLRPFPLRWLALAGLAALALLPLRACAALAAQMTLGGGLEQLEPRLDLIVPQGGNTALNLLVSLLGAGLLAPLAEELYFRGLLHRWFWARWPGRPWLRVLASSAIFGLGHFDSAGVVASSFILGALCALVYERTRSLWLAVAVHALNNSLAVLLVYAALAAQNSLGLP